MNRPLQQTLPARAVEPESAAAAGPAGEPDEELRRLREILLTSELDQITDLKRRLDDPEVRADEIARVVAEAVRRASKGDAQLAVALRPLVESGLQESIRRNPAAIVDTIYPILGPAIRKAVASAVRGMMESMNRVAEHSFTWRGLRWRMEAWRTGQSVAEIALRNSVVYRVEQVLLIHRETGLLLQAVGADAASRDQDLVSGMLTAIQDFVHDSFSVERDQNLDRLEVGDFQVWIERGPRAVLAAVIRGSAPRRLRATLSDAVASVHRDMRSRLEKFDGDPAPFEAVRPALEECLEQEFREERAGPSPALLAAAGLLVAALVAWAFLSGRDAQRWRRFEQAVRSEPGLVLVERQGGSAALLRDPFAAAPRALAVTAGFPDGEPELEVRPYLSVESPIVWQRLERILDPPDTARLAYDAGVLTVTGKAPTAWARRLEAATLPGVDRVVTSDLVIEERARLEAAARQLESIRLSYQETIVEPDRAQASVVDQLAAELNALLAQAMQLGIPIEVGLVGRADQGGAAEENRRLGEAGALALRRALVRRGVAAHGFALRGDLARSAEQPTAGVEIAVGGGRR